MTSDLDVNIGAAYWATVGSIYYACSKADALDDAGFDNPLSTFFSDQNITAEKRSVPFIQQKVDGFLAPFNEWNNKLK